MNFPLEDILNSINICKDELGKIKNHLENNEDKYHLLKDVSVAAIHILTFEADLLAQSEDEFFKNPELLEKLN